MFKAPSADQTCSLSRGKALQTEKPGEGFYFPLAPPVFRADSRNQMNLPALEKSFLMLEALEDRIAPASIVFSQGGNLLSSGDEGKLSLGDSSALLVKVLGGKALVFWDAQDKLIKGISVTNGAKLEIYGDVDGDIVTNLLSSGFLTDSDNNPANGQDGGKLLPSSISSIKIGSFIDQSGNIQSGSVGRIVAGGSVSNVVVSGALGGVFTGDGIFDAVATSTSPSLAPSTPATVYSFEIGFDFDSSGPLNATAMSLTKADATFATNTAIKTVSFTSGKNVQFFSGDAAAGTHAGGLITDVHYVATTIDAAVTTNFFAGKSMTMSAGDGGSGSSSGGAGGAISNVTDLGTSGNVVFHSGQGGDGTTNGGAGGKISLLDLRGTPLNYLVQAGDGGTGGTKGGAGGSIVNNNIAAVSSSQFITLAGDFHSNFTDGVLSDAERGFFVINRSSGEMVLVAGDTLTTIPPLILPKAANPVDAIMTDLNGDNFLDVVVAYNDGHFGVLINDQADGFRYSVGSLGGLVPVKVIAGDFLGAGGSPELAFIASTDSATTIKMFEITNAAAFAGVDPAAAFTSDLATIKPFTYDKGGLVDAVGGSFPLSTVGALHLNSDASDDLLLAFGDGAIQGVYATGAGTLVDPFIFSVGSGKLAAPHVDVSGGIHDIDFNFAKDGSQQRLAIVNAAGTKAFIGTVGAASLTSPATLTVSKTPLAFPDTGPVGTIYQAQWTNSILDTADTNSTNLALLASQGSSSSILTYDTSFALKNVYRQDFLVNSLADNFLVASKTLKGEADSFIFTTPSSDLALAFQHKLPTGSTLDFVDIDLPYAAKTVTVLAGNGGAAGKGTGGLGGSILSLNLDSGSSDLEAGDGGVSTSGAGGGGGMVDNSKSFKTAQKILIIPGLSSSADLSISAGDGASVTGPAAGAKGGNGGNIRSLLLLDSTTLDVSAGKGGSSQGGAGGTGGLLDLITIYNAGDANLDAGDGGNGTTSLKAAGGKGGSVSNILLGSMTATDGNVLSGNIDIQAGDGGLSALAKGGTGGSVSNITAGNAVDALGILVLTAGNGGSTASVSAAAGDGGSVTKIVSTAGGVFSAGGGNGGSSTAVGSKGKGGKGGAISSVTADMTTSGYSNILGGGGGNAVGGAGGTGGAVSNLILHLNPSDAGAGDETLGVRVGGGDGGNGASGGAGGSLSTFQANGIYDQVNGVQTVINSIALLLSAGDGGDGSVKTGGSGGSIKLTKTLEGISHVDTQSTNANFLPSDEGLRAFAGDGGNGVTKGGTGGLVSGIKVTNPLSAVGTVIPVNLLGGAFVTGGDGGDATNGTAGSGGSVSGLSLGVEGPASAPTGDIRIQAGNGGTAVNGSGGSGGSVSSSKLITIKGNDSAGYATLIMAGDGGDGSVKGGHGGSLKNLTTTLPQLGVSNTAPNIFSGVFLAGSGGSGTGAVKSAGGYGGSISAISQTQNVYSVMNLVQAGSGGNSSADVAGGKGGSVTNVHTVGSIGAQVARATIGGPQVNQGIYNTIATSTLIDSLVTTPDVQQGVFSGLGGSGLVDGANGKVSSIKAQNIAAIAAANLSGTFEKAATVSSITTLLLGFDLNGSGTYQSGDGFVMSGTNTVSSLNTLNKDLITTADLRANTAPFIIP